MRCGEQDLRVISGSARGKKLISLEGLEVRPTLDRVKESVFNMIAFDIAQARVLDLFCGSGALGIEALSRGAEEAVFVDSAKASLAVTQKNLEATHLLSQATLCLSDSVQFLQKTTEPFDLIFIDPPYKAKLYDAVVETIAMRGLLAPEGTLVIEAAAEEAISIPEQTFSSVREKTYGKVKILIIKA